MPYHAQFSTQPCMHAQNREGCPLCNPYTLPKASEVYIEPLSAGEILPLSGPMTPRQPFKCPLCQGDGVSRYVGSSTQLPNRISHPCHGCDGKGIVWSGSGVARWRD